MTVFILLIAIAALLQAAARFGVNPIRKFRDNARLATGATFVFTGLTHFLIPGTYMEMMPPFLPAPLLLVYLSGLFELAGGAGLFLKRTRRLAAVGLVLLLLAVFPANVNVAISNIQLGGFMNYPIYQWIRLPMQLVLIVWVWWCGVSQEAQK